MLECQLDTIGENKRNEQFVFKELIIWHKLLLAVQWRLCTKWMRGQTEEGRGGDRENFFEERIFNCLKGYSGQTIFSHSLTILTSWFLPLRLLGVFLQVRLMLNTVFQNHLLWVMTLLDVCFLVPTSITAHITLWSRYWSICLTFWLNCDVLQGKYSCFISALSLSK